MRRNGMYVLAFTLVLAAGSGQMHEGDRVAEARKTRANQLAAFKSFTAVNLNGMYDHRIQFLVGDTLKPYGVKWAEPSKTVPVLWLEFTTNSDPLLPKDHVLATLKVELRTELKKHGINEPVHLIRQPFGMPAWSFVAKSKEAAHERASNEIEKLMHQFGELWRESRKAVSNSRK